MNHLKLFRNEQNIKSGHKYMINKINMVPACFGLQLDLKLSRQRNPIGNLAEDNPQNMLFGNFL